MSIKKTYLIILFSFYSSTIHAFAPYTAIYDLYADTSMGNYKIGIAEFSLERNDNNYIYSSSASTTSMWSALYKFSRQEISVGTNIYDELVSRRYSIVENVGDNAEKNINIDFFPEKNYATYNNKKKWKIIPGTLVDELSVYLALSQDVKNNPSRSEFTYQVALEDKVKLQTFILEGNEIITINDEEINTTLVNCPDLNLKLNLSKDLEFLPVLINKATKKNTFRMVLKSFEFSN
jgi:hypothetical protein